MGPAIINQFQFMQVEMWYSTPVAVLQGGQGGPWPPQIVWLTSILYLFMKKKYLTLLTRAVLALTVLIQEVSQLAD